MKSVKALVFDFDGLILETEHPDFQSWSEAYQEHGLELTLDVWGDVIGRPASYFDPIADIEKARHLELIAALELLPGVLAVHAEARRLGLGLAVASSSSHSWVDGHLARLGLEFDCVRCRDDVEHAKPLPDLYLAAVQCLGVQPAQAVALEDSANGILAAKAAGLRCIAVPTPMTAGLDLSLADLRIESLDALPLAEMLRRVGGV
ncbi:MAG: HAD family hydrolase [Chloroflexi bacterium]|nr:MAG: HAD family hydrolase [Chloroflexota bacterium]